jgi:hypothetical protein
LTDEQPPSEPPGPTVKWENIAREYDVAGRLISERITTTVDTVLEQPEPPDRHIGFYL